MKKEELIGKKVRGFRFEKEVNSVWYMASQMDQYVGKEGIIGEYDPKFDSYRVKFEDGMSYHYPAERIEHHLVVEEENEKTKVVCTNTICQGECGECNYMEVVGQERQRKLVEPIESLDPLDDLPIIGDGVLMEVSIDRIDWFERYVFGKSKLGYILAWEENSDRKCFGWIEARPISKTKITRKEFESKFEIID
jgi:hypothetical protein